MGIAISEEIKKYYNEGIYLRRELHKIPELAFEEYKTSSFIVSYLKRLSFQVRTGIAKTGVVAFLPGRCKDKTLAFRADIDALPLSEKTGLEFASLHK